MRTDRPPVATSGYPLIAPEVRVRHLPAAVAGARVRLSPSGGAME